ncbi:hypothetical protein ACFL3D_02435 [Candidatus Omnitrophota bacterium]
MKALALSLIMVMVASTSYAAVGCTLNDPDRDVRRLFSKATNYKTVFVSIEERGGQPLADEIETQLGDSLDPKYEALDVPYAFYTILKGKEVIGYVHGVNEKGMYGGMQLILASDLDGTIIDFYYQKLSSPESKKFRSKDFTQKFVGLSLNDFRERDIKGEINDPSEKNEQDYKATLRGIKKNLIIFDRLMAVPLTENVTKEDSDVTT